VPDDPDEALRLQRLVGDVAVGGVEELLVYGCTSSSMTVAMLVYATLPTLSSPALRSARKLEPIVICSHP
jgi:hypothetical protein